MAKSSTVDFPRGGGSALSAIEIKKIRKQAENDVKEAPEEVVKKVKTGKNAKSKVKSSKSAIFINSNELSAQKKVFGPLSFKKLEVGMLLSCIVKEITDIDIVLALPNNAIAYASISEISQGFKLLLEKSLEDDDSDSIEIPDPKNMIKLGQSLVAKIISLEEGASSSDGKKKRRIEVTLVPSKLYKGLSSENIINHTVLQGEVNSIEDNGCIISFGNDGKDRIAYIESTDFIVGQIGLFQVNEISSRVIKLSRIEDVKTFIPSSPSNFSSLLPGTVVPTVVESTTHLGLLVNVSGLFHGSIDYFHVGNHNCSIEKEFKTGDKMNATIIFVNPSDKTIGLSFNSYKPSIPSSIKIGDVFENVKILRIDQGLGCLIQIEDKENLFGYVHVSRLADSKIDRISENFPVGSSHKARLVDVDLFDGLLQASLQKSVIERPFISYDDIVPGTFVTGKVIRTFPFGVLVSVTDNIKGICPTNHLTDIGSSAALGKFTTGQKFKFMVWGVDKVARKLFLTRKKTLLTSSYPRIISYANTTVGCVSHCVIVAVKNDVGCIVLFSNDVRGLVPLCELSDEFVETPSNIFKEGQVLPARIISVSAARNELRASFVLDPSPKKTIKNSDKTENPLKKSKINPAGEESLHQLVFGDLKVGHNVTGYVKNISEAGCFVKLSTHLSARIKISEMSDVFVKDWKSILCVGQCITARVLSLNENDQKVELTLKTESAKEINFENIQVGSVIDGLVKSIVRFGLFIAIKNSKLSGLCHVSNLPEEVVENFDSAFKVGESVRVKIVDVDKENKRIVLSMRDLQEEVFDEIESMKIDEDVYEDGEGHTSNQKDSEAAIKPLLSQTTFNWNDEELNGNNDSNNDSETSDSEQTTSTSSKRSKKQLKKLQKEEMSKKIKEFESGSVVPVNPEDYERLLISSPNNSFLWIKLMASHLKLNQVEKSREVARRALCTINYREESEKRNIWFAMLNLENSYGSEDSLDKVFKESLLYNEPKKMYLQLANIYTTSKDHKKTENLYKEITKKFRQSAKVWILFSQFHFVHSKNQASARKVFQDALQALPKRKHVKFIVKFAQFEYRHGDPERGRTFFESVIANYPKRSDIWSIYITMEINGIYTEQARRLFERVVQYKFSSKKMKVFFKKWLEFEKGFPETCVEGVEKVKNLARAYVESRSNISVE